MSITHITDRRTLARMRLIRPDLRLTAILPRDTSDGPYMRTFETAGGEIARLRTANGGAS